MRTRTASPAFHAYAICSTWWRTFGLVVPALVGAGAASADLPPGYEVVQVTFDFTVYDSVRSLNNCGEISFTKKMGPSWADAEILLYDNGKTTRVTDNHDRDVLPYINNAGMLAWGRGIGDAGVHQVVLYENGQETILVDVPLGLYDQGPINDQGHIPFAEATNTGCVSADTRVWLYDGSRFIEVIGPPYSHQSLDLNDFDGIAWTRYNWCLNPWDSDILLWSGGQTRVLTTMEDFEVQIPRINDRWQVVWGGPGGIRMWDGSGPALSSGQKSQRPITITDDGVVPDLNNLGEISFGRFHEDIQRGQIWLYRDGQFYQITNDPVVSHNGSKINDWGEIVWKTAVYPNGDLMFLRRIRTGEADFDGDIDLEDARVLQECLTGPGDFDRLCDCRFLDLDHDRDVDLADFARFQRAYTGP